MEHGVLCSTKWWIDGDSDENNGVNDNANNPKTNKNTMHYEEVGGHWIFFFFNFEAVKIKIPKWN